MFTIQNYVLAESPEQAYTLNQKRTAVVLGGCGWLKMGKQTIATAIDLSALGLDTITETDTEFVLGAMVTLRQMETDARLTAQFGSFLADSVRHIVGIQFRNCATIGGSLFARFGFSDILTAMLVLDAQVELFQEGRMPLTAFVQMPRDRDILLRVYLPKQKLLTYYDSYRNTITDLPSITVAAACPNADTIRIAVGARPQKAACKEFALPSDSTPETLQSLAQEMANAYAYDSNMRASAAYRQHLAKVFLYRALCTLLHKEG